MLQAYDNYKQLRKEGAIPISCLLAIGDRFQLKILRAVAIVRNDRNWTSSTTRGRHTLKHIRQTIADTTEKLRQLGGEPAFFLSE